MKRIALITAVLVLALTGCAMMEADKGTASDSAEAAASIDGPQTPTAAPDRGTSENAAKIFDALNSLKYHPYTCDGLPEYRLSAADGTVYWINLSGKWVWRKSEGQAEVSEAGLSEDLIARLKENADLTPTEYTGIETHLDPDDP